MDATTDGVKLLRYGMFSEFVISIVEHENHTSAGIPTQGGARSPLGCWFVPHEISRDNTSSKRISR